MGRQGLPGVPFLKRDRGKAPFPDGAAPRPDVLSPLYTLRSKMERESSSFCEIREYGLKGKGKSCIIFSNSFRLYLKHE